MAYEKALHFYVLVDSHRRIAVRTLAERLECTPKHVYSLIQTASRYMPIRLEAGIVINETPRRAHHDGKNPLPDLSR